jgi:ribose/xylose/arabinose/galactoside ABC-type transport system permease subunit
MKYGQYLYAVGGNVSTATASGVNVFFIKLMTYMIMGLFTGIAGIILTSRVNAGQPAIGVGYELDAIAAVVIGGASLNGGVGTIPGTVIGILMIGIINNGMNLMGVSSFYQQIVKGIIILAAVLLDIIISRRKTR